VTSRTFSDYVAGFDEFGDRLALTNRTFLKIKRLSHRELKSRAYQAAHYLSDQGIARGDRVMVVAPNSPEWVELLLGTALIGAVLVTVDASSTLRTVQRFIEETEPKIVFVGKYLHLGEAPFSTRVLDDFDESITPFPNDAPAVVLEEEWPAFIVFTSGTTADPKGVVLTQRNVLSNIEGILSRIDVGSDWRLLSVLPLSHMYELTGTLAVLSRGASVFYIPRVTPQGIAEALADYQITTILAIPQLLTLMLERVEQSAKEEGKAKVLSAGLAIADRLPFTLRRVLFRSVHSRLGGHLDLVVTGGAPIPIDVATTWEKMGVRMVQGYGLTETSPILACNSLDVRRQDSPGRALENVQLRIGPEDEIQAKGPSVFREYWHNLAATTEAFTDDGWFRTGDVGRLEDGWLEIQGRLKFAVVRSSGLKVFPEDLELMAERDPRFEDLCVVGVKGDQGETVEAVLTSQSSDQEVDAAIAALNAQLASFQHVDGWRRWPEGDFPRTRLLKIDRRKVQEWANAVGEVRSTRPAETESTGDPVVHVIRLSLDDPRASVLDTDHLGDLGLDSLRRLNVVALLEEQLGVAISDESITPATTVSELRTLAREGSPVQEASIPARWPYGRAVRVVGNALRDHVIYSLVRRWVRLDVVGADRLVGLKTPAIFIFNHSDDFDGPVIYQAVPRELRRRLAVATGADVMRAHRLLAFIVRLCYAGFPFARSEPYVPSLQYVGEMVDKGWNVLIAPEGHLSTDAQLQPFKSGIGLLAVNLGVPVVPLKTFGLAGTVPLHAKWPKKRSRVTVRIGAPLRFGPVLDYEDVTETLRRAMETL
jgi:long-chain acyl-CoA synthetase